MKMKRIIASAASAVVMLLVLCSCGREIVSVMPAYRGPELTDLNHEFTAEDFYVIVAYDDRTDSVAEEFGIEVVGLKDGYYKIEITVEDFTEITYVKVDLPIYPSDKE